MATDKKEKKFDAVKMMRERRDEISAATQDMDLEQLKAYIKSKLMAKNVKKIGI